MKGVLAAALLSIACSGGQGDAPRPPRADHGCASIEDCDRNERECRQDYGPACETCAGLVVSCTSRTPDEIASLDRAKQACEARPHGAYSYVHGCQCEGADCPTPQAWCETGGGVYSDQGCIEGELRRPQ